MFSVDKMRQVGAMTRMRELFRRAEYDLGLLLMLPCEHCTGSLNDLHAFHPSTSAWINMTAAVGYPPSPRLNCSWPS